MIRDGKSHQIPNLIRQGRREGMILMDDALSNLVESEVVRAEDAYEKSVDKIEFRKRMRSLGFEVGVAMSDEELAELGAEKTQEPEADESQGAEES